MKFAWLPCSLILRKEQGSEKENAEVNTLKRPCARLLPDNRETRTQYWVP